MLLIKGSIFSVSKISVDREGDKVDLTSVQLKDSNGATHKFKLGVLKPATLSKLIFAKELTIGCDIEKKKYNGSFIQTSQNLYYISNV